MTPHSPIHTHVLRTAAVLLTLVLHATPAHAARLDLTGGVLEYLDQSGGAAIANALTVTLAGDTYTLHDPAEASVNPTPNALAGGCAPVDAQTVTCPAAAIVSFTILTRNGDDHVTLTGVAVPTFVDSGTGNDVLVGGDADDFFFWNVGDGSDRIDGGLGNDTLEFDGSNASEHFRITPDGSGFDLQRDIGGVRMVVQHTEALELFTKEGTDDVATQPLVETSQHLEDGIGDPDGLADVLLVGDGGLCLTQRDGRFESEGRQPITFVNFPEVLVSGASCAPNPCDDAVVTQGCTVNHVRNQPCQGTPGDDVIVGTTAADVIRGGGGNDRILGGAGDDLLCGEDGDDNLIGGRGDDTLVGGPGADRLDGGSGNDVLRGNEGDDLLIGGARKDDLDGGAGNDQIKGGADADTLQGGIGIDAIDGGGGDDRCGDTDQAGPFRRCEGS